MRLLFCIAASAVVFSLLAPVPARAHSARGPYGAESVDLVARLAVEGEPPPLPAGVAELQFGEFFRMPAGPLGLEFTERLKSLDGRRVRIVGYVVGNDVPSPGRFILSPYRITLATAADGPADDLPPAHAYVALPSTHAALDLPPLPLPVMVEGTLRLGAQQEADSRVSWVRIEMDPADPRLRTSESHPGEPAHSGDHIHARAEDQR